MLQKPGADVVIIDEAHKIKNPNSATSQALKEIQTWKRVCLTGYPLQNNLSEYWCMVDFAKPRYLGSREEFRNMFENPIKNGSCADSTSDDVRKAKKRSYVLHNKLKTVVQRYDSSILKNAIPRKYEFAISCKLSKMQKELYLAYVHTANGSKKDLLSSFNTLLLLGNHPAILKNSITQKQQKVEIVEEELINEERVIPVDQSTPFSHPLFDSPDVGALEHSTKVLVLLEIVDQCVQLKQKVLVFSQSLLTLDFLEEILQKRTIEFFRLDGTTKEAERQRLIDKFNEKTCTVPVFLISTRAGSLGINLFGANRVVLFDLCWNPCHDAEAAVRVRQTYYNQQQQVRTNSFFWCKGLSIWTAPAVLHLPTAECRHH
jgi:RAD54-like protein 2